jgi:hypothetical protein
MSSKAPFFITGGNCKIRVNGVTLAFATDFRYSIKIKHSNVKILGVYEHDTAEPLSYDVDGSFTVIRYVEGLKKNLTNQGFNIPEGVSNSGNGVGSFTRNGPIEDVNSLRRTLQNVSYALVDDGRANEALDPSKLSTGSWFEIEFYQKIPGGQTGIAKIKGCRIVQADAQIQRRGVFSQTFQFVANGVDEDSFLASESGVGQTQA